MATDTSRAGLASNPPVLTAVVIGGVLTLVGVVAPLVAGAEGEFIVFGRNYLHDAIHVLTGVAGLAAGFYAGGKFARGYAVGLGAVYLLVAVLGVVLLDLLRELIALNTADNALHFLLAIVLLGVGLVFRGGTGTGA